MLATRRSSIRIRSNRHARSVLVFSAQSLRASASRERSRAIASLRRARRPEPRLARASLRCKPQQPPLPPGDRRGTISSSPVDSAALHRDTPVDAAPRRRCPGAGMGARDGGEGDMPAAGPVPGDPVGLRGGNGAGPAEPHPSRLRHPHLAGLAAEPADLPRLDRDDPESLIPARLAPRRPAVGAGEEVRHGLGEVPQRLLLDHLAARAQPVVLRAGGGELAALLQVARRAGTAGPPPGLLLDRQVPHVPGMRAMVPQHRLLGGRREQPVPGHANTLANTTDIPGEVKRRSLPSLKAGVSTPRP